MKKRTVVIATILCSGLLIGGNEYIKAFAQNKPVQEQTQVVHNAETIQVTYKADTVSKTHCLAKEDALNLLKENNYLDYLYQGDENDFDVLKEKGLSGYVFLPDIDTDMGYFVDKNTKEIYYFHPNGYLELIINND